MAIKISIFLSAPTMINADQQVVYDFVCDALGEENLQPRALGRSDFPQSDPTTEVYYMMRACYGGIILGFTQIEATSGTIKPGTSAAKEISQPVNLPTPWNQIEAGIMLAMRKPILVFAQEGVSGGVFDQGAFPGFLQVFNPLKMGEIDWENMRERIRLWSADVRHQFRN
jgi:hypothetical protein